MTGSPSENRVVTGLRRTLGTWRHRLRVVGAMVLLGIFGLAQRVVPMPRWSRALGQAAAVPDGWKGRKIEQLSMFASTPVESRVASAIFRASRALPWKPTCLAEAATGQVLLRLARSSGVVVIGLRKTDLNVTDHWDAHAWLLGARGALTGGPAASGFTATTVYEVRNGLRATDVELVNFPRSAQ